MFHTSIIYLVDYCKLCKNQLTRNEVEERGVNENPVCFTCLPPREKSAS